MNRILTVFCALALVVAFTATAQAEVQNVKVSGDINTYGIYRDDYDLNSDSSSTGTDDAWYQTTTKVEVNADLTDNVAATVRLLNERDWATTTNDTNVDLNLAYITLKEMLYSPMTLKIGRQELSDLTDLVVGDPDTNDAETSSTSITAADLSAKKAFDAIRADFDYAPWTLTLLTAKINDSDVSDSAAGTGSEDLYGVNAAYNFAEYNAMGEGYVFYKDADSGATGNTDQEIYTIGLKGSMDANDALTLGAEAAMQTGDYDSSQDQDAWALDLSADYAVPNNAYTPTLGIAYIYRSGDSDTSSGDREAWNVMYENQTHGKVANAIFTGNNDGVDSNAQIVKLSGAMNPTEAVTLGVDYYHYWLDEKVSTVNMTPTDSTATMNDDDDFGDEVDVNLTYDYTEDVQFGLSYGVFMPGDAFADGNDDDASQVLGSVNVSF